MEACSPHIWTTRKFCIISFCHVSRQEVQHPEQCSKQSQPCCGPQVRVPKELRVYMFPIRKSCLLHHCPDREHASSAFCGSRLEGLCLSCYRLIVSSFFYYVLCTTIMKASSFCPVLGQNQSHDLGIRDGKIIFNDH